jgi:hypothetical protein
LVASRQSELAEQVGLIEVEMFRGQLVAANLVTRHPAEVDVPSRGRDIARRRAHDTGVRAYEPALGGDDGSFGEKACASVLSQEPWTLHVGGGRA